MCHGGEIHHERGGPKIVHRGVSGSRTGREHRSLQRGDPELPVRLTERNKSHSGGHQIGDITLEKGGQGEARSEEHTSELQSHSDLVCRLLLEKKKRKNEETKQKINVCDN